MSDKTQQIDHPERRSEAFFGRRKAKALSPAQAQRFERLFPDLRIDLAGSPPADIGELFRHRPENVILEIGFGGAEHLIHQAKTNPQNGYIGVEPFVNSMAKALKSIEDNKLDNIRLYDEDATELLDWMPPACIDRIDLLYPDPWPKFRHWKRRFVSRKNLNRFAGVLKLGGRFHFASDIDTYVNWTLQHCDQHPDFAWLAEINEDWEAPFANWTRTRYEAKALREGRTPCYLRFERK